MALCVCRLTNYRHRFARAAPAPRAKRNESWTWTCIARQLCVCSSSNQVLTHAARAAAKQLNRNFNHSVAARGAREGPWSGQCLQNIQDVPKRCPHRCSLQLRNHKGLLDVAWGPQALSEGNVERSRAARQAYVGCARGCFAAFSATPKGSGQSKLLNQYSPSRAARLA